MSSKQHKFFYSNTAREFPTGHVWNWHFQKMKDGKTMMTGRYRLPVIHDQAGVLTLAYFPENSQTSLVHENVSLTPKQFVKRVRTAQKIWMFL